MKNNILKKLTGKYKINQTQGKLDPYLQVGSALNPDNTGALTTKMSVPLLEGTLGKYAVPSEAGLRLVNQNTFSKSVFNGAGGLEAYLNKNINNSDASFESTIGGGIGGRSTDGVGGAGLYGNADLSLYQNSSDKNTQFGLKGSYGTKYAPNAGGYLGVTAKRNALTKRGLFRGLGIEGNVGYNFKSKMPTAGINFNLRDGGVSEHGEGGYYDKAASFGLKALKAMPRVASIFGKGAKSLTLPSMLLGSGSLGEGSTVTDANGVNKYTGEQTNNLFSNLSGGNTQPKPQFNANQTADATNYFKGAVAPQIPQMEDGGMRKMYNEGGVNLPGGTMEPIPGSDAVVFKGATHDQGGIGVDKQTEVEGGGFAPDGTPLEGETMDKVVMSKGGPKDYFFSDHLKKGGMSYAEQHKNILQNGGGQQEINMLAKMQEKAANRDPKQVAKLGGVVKYEQGGVLGETFDEYVERMQAERRDNQIVGEDQFNENMGRLQRREDRRPPIVEQKRRKLRNLQLFVDQGRELTPEQQEEYNILANDRNLNDGPLAIKPIEMQQIPNEMSEPELELPALSLNPNMDPSALNDAGVVGMSQEEVDLAKGIDNTYDAYLARTQMSGEMPEGGVLSEKKYNRQQRIAARKLNRQLNPGMPLEAKIGAAAQFIPAVAAMFNKQKDPEEFTYNSGFKNPIVAGRVKGQVYNAPDQNEARARLASAYTGEQRFLDTAGAGSSAFGNRQALFAKKLQGEGTLGAQESKDALTAENLTKKSAEQANVRNVQNELTASTTNAQLSQREADRLAAVENANISLRNATENQKQTNKMAILNNFSQGIAGVMGDTMQYKADERVAKAQGLYGIYERDRLTTALAGQINPATGNPYTQQEIALKASGLKS